MFFPVLFAGLLAREPAWAQTPDAALATGRKFAPFVFTLKPAMQMSPLPGWMSLPARVQPELATVELPIPAHWAEPAIEFYAVTVVFEDRGDGGPAVEWRAADGTTTVVSTGLGEVGNPLGLNARTLLLPQKLTLQGGLALVSYYGKFDGLVSVSVRPARENLLAVLGAQSDPALVDEALRVFDRNEVDGTRPSPLTGDVRHGSVVEAELSAGVQKLDGEVEFVVPLEGTIEASVLHLDALGLDPEACIDVRVNSHAAGSIGFPPFRLDDPALVPDTAGHLVLAGWRSGSLFIPARLLVAGENSIVVSVRSPVLESDRAVFLKNTSFHVRFGASAPVASVTSAPKSEPPAPDLTLPNPLVPDPSAPVLPEIVTSLPR